MMGLISAFLASTAIAPLLAFDYGDLHEANSRYNMYYYNTTEALGSVSATPVTDGLSKSTAMSSTLAILALVCAVSGRIIGIMAEDLPKTANRCVNRLLLPFVLMSTIPALIAAIVTIVSFYYSGWVVYPEQTAGALSWPWSGFWLIISIFILFVYVVTGAIYLTRTTWSPDETMKLVDAPEEKGIPGK